MSAHRLTDLLQQKAIDCPERIAVIDGDQHVTYGQLHRRARAIELALLDDGVEAGDRVALVAENSADYLAAAMGIWLCGGICATVYPSFGQRELDYVFTNASPTVVLTDADRVATTQDAANRAGSPASVNRLEEFGAALAHGTAADRTAEAGACALICYTSGTTSQPKPVAHSHAGLAAAASAYADVWRIETDDRVVVAMPMAWVFGLVPTSLATLIRGGTVVVLPHFNPIRMLAALETHAVTVLPAVTTMIVKLLSYAKGLNRPLRLDSLRFCVAGGEARNEVAFDAWRELTGCPVHDVYAASECFPVITYDPVCDPEPRPRAAGRIVRGAKMRVVDEHGRDLQQGEIGEALWKGPAMMLGYWNEPELSAAAMSDGNWYRPRDQVKVDSDGYVFVVGRSSEMIIRGGSNVAPAEVEAVLRDHTDVLEAVVVGVPDPAYGERVVAAVVLRDDAALDSEALADHCAVALAPYKVPSSFQEFSAFPRNASGKVSRTEISAVVSLDEGARR